MRTVYPQARKFISIIFWLAIVAILLTSAGVTAASFMGAIQSESLLALLPALGLLVLLVIYVYVLIFLKSVATAYFDAVDVLIESNRRKKEEKPNGE
jgi:multisubunit Na+/H+ antiporter MnhE subunit